MGQGNIIGKPNLPAATSARGVWNLREQNTANRASLWPGYDPQWDKTSLLLKTALPVGDSFIDSSANAFTVTKTGDTIQTTATPYAPYWSCRFDGAGDYIQAASTTALNFGTADFTVEAWINLNAASGGQSIIAGTATGCFGFRYGTTWNGAANGLSIYKGSTADCENATFAFVPGRWYHVAVSRQSGTVRFFVDGTQLTTAGSGYNGYNVPAEANVRIGTSDVANSEHFNGHISNVRVTKSAVYTASFTPPTAPLTAITNTTVLACQDNRFISNGTTSLSFARTGDVAVSRFSPFAWTWSAASGGGAYFDGSGDYLSVPGDTTLAFGTGDFTVELWLNLAVTGTAYNVMDFRPSGTNGLYPDIYYNGSVMAYLNNGVDAIVGTTVVQANAWTHVALCRSGTTTRLFVNGVLNGSITDASSYLCGTNRPFIGGHGYLNNSSNSWYGSMAGIRVIKGTALYTAAFTPPTTAPTAVSGTSLLLNFTNPAFSDTSGLASVVRQVGSTVSRGRAAPSAELTSVGFNGGTEYLTVSSPSGQLGAGDFTVEAWVYPFSRISNLPTVWGNYSTWGAGAFGLWVGHSSHTTNFSVGINGTYPALVSSTTIAYNTWTHLAVVRSNGVIRLYVNGFSEGGTFASTAVLNQGAGSSWVSSLGDSIGTSSFNGFISNLRVERSARYIATFTPDRTPTVTTANTALALNQTLDVWDATARNNLANTGTVVATPFMFTGSALSLNGSQLARAYSGTLATDFAFGTGDFTIEAWIFPTSSSGDRCIFTTRGSAANAVYFGMYTNAYTLGYYTAGAWIVTSTVAAPANAWSHVALVRANGVAYLYLNGVCVGSAANTTNLSESVGTIGRSTGDNAYGFIGQLDEVRVTKAARYLGNFTPTTAPFDRDWEPPYNDTLVTSNVLQVKSIDLAGATNNVFRDDSTNNLLPVRYGDVTQGSLSPYIPTGYWSAYFDGSGDYLTVASNAGLQFATSDFTIECWVNKSASGVQNLLVWGVGGGAANDVVIYTGSANDLVFYANGAARINAGTLILNKWHHIAAVRQSGTTRLYLDGIQVGSWVDATNYTASIVAVGWSSSTWNGHISNLRVVKGAAVYTGSTFIPPNAPLTAISGTSLLTFQDNRLIDRSTNSLALTRFGDVAVSRFDPFPFTVPVTTVATTNPGSVYLDGAGGDFLSAPNAAANITNQNYTAEAWVWFNVNNVGYQPIFANAGTGDAHGWILITETNNYLYAYHSASGGSWNYNIGTSYQPTVNTWTHLALVRNGTTITLYANGVSIGSTSIGTNSVQSPSNAFYLGYYPWFPGGARSLNGHISNFRMVIGTAVYTANFTVPTSPLTAITNTSLLLAQDANAITTDASVNRYAITVGGDARGHDRYPFANPATKRATYTYGGSGYFDGTGDYLMGSTSGQAFGFGTGDYTVEAWINPGTGSGSQCIVGGSSGCFAFRLGASYGGYLTGLQVTRSQVADYDNCSFTFVPNVWYHVAVTRQAGTVRFFVNGVQQTTGNTANSGYNWPNETAFTVGTAATGAGNETYTGHIANLRVVKGTAVYTANFTPPTSPVTAISGTSLLLNFDNAGVYDATGQRNLLTSGTAASTTTSRKYEVATQAVDGTTTSRLVPVPASPSGLAFGTGDFTVEMWIYPTTIAGATRVFYDHRTLNTQGVYPTLYLYPAGTLAYYVSSGDRITGATLATGTWYHVAVSRAASQTRLFLNGVQQGATYADTNSYLDGGTGRPCIGTNGNSADGNNFAGYIEGLRISRVGRYTANFTVPSEPFPIA